jgi:transcription termination factor Rho
MTEPTFSLTGEPSAPPADKPVRKRSAAAGASPKTGAKAAAKSTSARTVSAETDSLPQALKGRSKSIKSAEIVQAAAGQPLESLPKKRASRTASKQKISPTETPTPSVQESQPAEQAASAAAKLAPLKARRKKEPSPTPSPEAPQSVPPPQEALLGEARSISAVQGRSQPGPRGRRGRQDSAANAVASHTPHPASAPETRDNGPASTAPADPVADPSERLRKPYPVYVPLHIAKQMEQEGRPAPLAVAPDAQQAEAIRTAALENRHATQPQHSGNHAVSQADAAEQAERREGHRHERHQQQLQPQHRQDRNQDRSQQQQHPNQRHDRNQRNPQRGPGPERGRDGRNNDRNRNREEHRRNDRRDQSSEAGYQDSHREHQQNLPPPTPEELSPGSGIIEVSGKGFGFLRDPLRNFVQHPADIFVSPEMVRRFNLRDGQMIQGSVRKSGRGQQMHEITSVNDDPPEESKHQPAFDELTVINPCEPLLMATVPERYTTRIIDMLTPIGKGQRGLIVAQPRTGKTTFLQHIADAMVKNHPEVKLIILLVDERPEEVTEIRHTVPSAEIMASSNDMDVRSHTRIAELAIERAKRLVEAGKDVFILLDSITRLGRAFNNALSNGGRTMSGGLDARALETPRKLFAAARNTEEAGSLTIIATALIDTGSRMDEIIFQEFKGTGNMELVLDRKIAESRIYPAVDIFQSGTRREELLVPADQLQKIHFLRRGLSGARPMDAIDRLLSYLKKFQTNEQMLREIRG